MLKETEKIHYLRKIERCEAIFQPKTKDWLKKLVRLGLRNTVYKGEFLGNESIDDYILKELKSEKLIEEKNNNENIDPNNHLELTQKGKHFLKSYKDSLKYRTELWLGDYPLLFTNLIAIIALIISIIALLK